MTKTKRTPPMPVLWCVVSDDGWVIAVCATKRKALYKRPAGYRIARYALVTPRRDRP